MTLSQQDHNWEDWEDPWDAPFEPVWGWIMLGCTILMCMGLVAALVRAASGGVQ